MGKKGKMPTKLLSTPELDDEIVANGQFSPIWSPEIVYVVRLCQVERMGMNHKLTSRESIEPREF